MSGFYWTLVIHVLFSIAMRERIRASALCIYNEMILTVKLEDPTSKVTRCYLPGGKIEEGEHPANTAVRETFEETGYLVRVDHQSERKAQYPFCWDNEMINVTTYFYKASLITDFDSPNEISDAHYHRGVFWIPQAQREELFNWNPDIYKLVGDFFYY